MGTLTKQWDFTVATDSDATKVNQNFDDIIDFINGQVIQKDGSLAFDEIPSGPAEDPTTINQFARKGYVDQTRLLAVDEHVAGVDPPTADAGGYKTIAGSASALLLAAGGEAGIAYLPVTFPGGGFTNGVLAVIPFCTYQANRGTGPHFVGATTKTSFNFCIPGGTVGGASSISYIAIGW